MSEDELKVDYNRKHLPEKVITIGLVLSIVGLIFVAISFIRTPVRSSYLSVATFIFTLSVGLGAMFAIALEYITSAEWSMPFRRIAEHLASLIFVSPLFLIPPIINRGELYPASDNSFFLYLRLLLIFLIWFVLYALATDNSQKQNTNINSDFRKKNVFLYSLFLISLAVGLYIISVDWLNFSDMSWRNAIEWLYLFAGVMLAGFAVWTYVSILLNEKAYLFDKLSQHNYYGFGGFLFAFIVFWGYIAFVQLLLVWYANIPEEVAWFVNRSSGRWQYFLYGLFFLQFLVPFILLLPQKSKINPKQLQIVSIILLIARFADWYWLIIPEYSKNRFTFCLLDLSFPILAFGLGIIIFYDKARRKSLVPLVKPKLQKNTKYKI